MTQYDTDMTQRGNPRVLNLGNHRRNPPSKVLPDPARPSLFSFLIDSSGRGGRRSRPGPRPLRAPPHRSAQPHQSRFTAEERVGARLEVDADLRGGERGLLRQDVSDGVGGATAAGGQRRRVRVSRAEPGCGGRGAWAGAVAKGPRWQYGWRGVGRRRPWAALASSGEGVGGWRTGVFGPGQGSDPWLVSPQTRSAPVLSSPWGRSRRRCPGRSSFSETTAVAHAASSRPSSPQSWRTGYADWLPTPALGRGTGLFGDEREYGPTPDPLDACLAALRRGRQRRSLSRGGPLSKMRCSEEIE